jgi:hypothetical protein
LGIGRSAHIGKILSESDLRQMNGVGFDLVLSTGQFSAFRAGGCPGHGFFDCRRPGLVVLRISGRPDMRSGMRPGMCAGMRFDCRISGELDMKLDMRVRPYFLSGAGAPAGRGGGAPQGARMLARHPSRSLRGSAAGRCEPPARVCETRCALWRSSTGFAMPAALFAARHDVRASVSELLAPGS